MTHSELVERACKWLKNSMHCPIVLMEVDGVYDRADAVGIRVDHSILVEAKVSRGDFFRDAKKIGRRHTFARPAAYCWYITTPNLVKPAEIPEDWGLLYCYPKQVRRIKYPPHISVYAPGEYSDYQRIERRRLYNALNNLQYAVDLSDYKGFWTG